MNNKTFITLPNRGVSRICYRLALLFAIVFFVSYETIAQNWVLRWQDNFENGVFDETNTWNVEVNGLGGGNNELQYYRHENITIEKYQGLNCLVLNARKESFMGKEATSGRINTLGKVYVQYGKIEARMKIPSTANGLWPAFWFLGNDYNGSNWPYCSEIDVMECGHSAGISSGHQSSFMGGAIHWGPITPAFIHYQDYTAAEAPYSIQDDFHLFTLIWDADSLKMYLDLDKFPKVAPYYSKRISADQPNDIYSYFHKPVEILFNLAVGGAAFTGIGNISGVTALPADGTPAKMYIDYIRVYQKGDAGEQFHSNTTYTDIEAPTGITATTGAVTQTSAEFLLNGTDNSGSVIYIVSYNGTTSSVEAASDTQKSFVVTGLMPGTTYNFTVTAKDASGNAATTAFIPLSVSTLPNSDCAGISNAATEGAFAAGYKYSFTTSGTDVTVNFEMLDNKAGVVAYLRKYSSPASSSYTESQMTNVSGKKFTKILTGQTLGADIKVSCKFAFAGGLSVTKQLTYTVGNTCAVNTAIETVKTSLLHFYPNPVLNILYIQLPEEDNRLSVYDMIGNKVFDSSIPGTYNLDMSSLNPGVYFLKTENARGIQSFKVIKK